MHRSAIIALLASVIVVDAAPLVERADVPIATIYPNYTSQYNYATGAVEYHTPSGYVYRNPKNNGADISTLVTFAVDKKYADYDCQVVFDLTNSTSLLGGSKKAQIYTSIAPAYTDAKSWPSGNLRDQNLGSINVVKGGRATWEAGSGPGATANGTFPCSDLAGYIYGGEIAPMGDEDEIKWPTDYDGPKIIVW